MERLRIGRTIQVRKRSELNKAEHYICHRLEAADGACGLGPR